MLRAHVVFITGAASGIGRALALGAARQGAVIWATDIDADGAAAVAGACRALGAQARELQLDVTDGAAVNAAIAAVVATDGRLDYCFNNAGIGSPASFAIRPWSSGAESSR
jgi:all-trans-retinol dehydrogenase (NAD+)